jgi:hypothetical protein
MAGTASLAKLVHQMKLKMKAAKVFSMLLLLCLQAYSQLSESITSLGAQAGSMTGLQLRLAGVCMHGQRTRPYPAIDLSAGKWMDAYAWYKINPSVPYTGYGVTMVATSNVPLTQRHWKSAWIPTFSHGYGLGLMRLQPSNPEDYWSASTHSNFYFCTHFGLALEAPKRVIAMYLDARPFVGVKRAPHRWNAGCMVQVGVRARISRFRKIRPF